MLTGVIQLAAGPAADAFANTPIVESDGTSDSAPPLSFGAMLETLLVPHVPAGQIPSLETAAEIVGTSPRTLRRRLYDEGIGYRQVTDRVRFRRARELPAESGLSTTEIAYGLGYFRPNDLVRAFRRVSALRPDLYGQKDDSGESPDR